MEKLWNFFNGLFTKGAINGIISIIIALILAKLASTFLDKWIDKKDEAKIPILKRFKKIVIFLAVLSVISMQFEATQNIAKTLLASSGLLAIVVGLASQEAASNMINGMMIIAYKPYKINDFVSVKENNIKGKVIDIALRHTIIETLEKTQLIVPNTIMNKAIIENITDTTGVKVNHLFITISYDSDIDLAKSIIIDCASHHPLFVDKRNFKEKEENKPAIDVYCTNWLDSSVELRADVTTDDNVDGFTLMSDLRQELIQKFKENDIEIPFNQLDIHQK